MPLSRFCAAAIGVLALTCAGSSFAVGEDAPLPGDFAPPSSRSASKPVITPRPAAAAGSESKTAAPPISPAVPTTLPAAKTPRSVKHATHSGKRPPHQASTSRHPVATPSPKARQRATLSTRKTASRPLRHLRSSNKQALPHRSARRVHPGKGKPTTSKPHARQINPVRKTGRHQAKAVAGSRHAKVKPARKPARPHKHTR